MTRMFLAAAITFAFVASAAAQTPGNTAKGSGIAQSSCAACHAVGRWEARSRNPLAPRFADVANWPGMTERALRVWLQTSHPTMPNFVLNRDDTDDIVAYILSLKVGHRAL